MNRKGAALAVAMIALCTDMLVYGLAVPVLPTIASRAGASQAAIGVLFASYAGALIAATPLVGRWVDRFGLRRPMLAGLLGLAAATLLFAFADSLWLLITARALQGLAAAVSWTASFALLAATYPPEKRGKAMGTALSAVGIGTLLGPPLGGFLYEQLGQEAPFLFAAALAAGDGIARWTIVRDPPRQAAGEGYRALLGRPRVPLLIALTALGAALLAFMEPILPLHLSAEFGAASGTIGLLFGLAVLASSLVAPAFGAAAERLPPPAMIAAGAALGGGGLILISAASSVWLTAVALAGIAVAGALVLVPTLPLIAGIAEARDPPSYGAAYALYTLAYAVGLMAGPLLAGGAASALDFDGAALVAAAVSLAAGATTALASRPGYGAAAAGREDAGVLRRAQRRGRRSGQSPAGQAGNGLAAPLTRHATKDKSTAPEAQEDLP